MSFKNRVLQAGGVRDGCQVGIDHAFGCSLGGSFVGLLAARQNIHMDYGSWLILVIDSK